MLCLLSYTGGCVPVAADADSLPGYRFLAGWVARRPAAVPYQGLIRRHRPFWTIRFHSERTVAPLHRSAGYGTKTRPLGVTGPMTVTLPTAPVLRSIVPR